MKKLVPGLALLTVLVLAVTTSSQPTPREQVGWQPDGKFLLNNGWRVKPVGQQVALDTFPMSALVSTNGRFMIVMNAGYKPPSLSVVDLQGGRVLSRVPVADAWLGMAMSPQGKTLWVGGGSTASIYEFTFNDDGVVTPSRTFELVPQQERTWQDFIGDVAVTPDGRLLYAADLYHDQILVVNPQSGRVIDKFKTGRRPYRILFHPDGKSFFVTSWADGTLLHHQADNGYKLDTVPLGAHPTDIVWRLHGSGDEDDEQARYHARLFVSAANTNNVYSIGVTDNKDLRRLETINVAMTHNMPLGMTPSALALSPDSNRLYVVCSDANVVGVVNITESRSHVLGFIPTGWYPTAARALADGRVVVLNGRGAGSYPNRRGPNPTKGAVSSHEGTPVIQYVGAIQTGSASIIPPIPDEAIDEYTKQALANSPYDDNKLGDLGPLSKPSAIPTEPGGPTPIQHVIYIVKENRTYDQVLGDVGKGESDPSLVLFDEKISPNHHKLAREFVLLDNFYVNADVSADGHAWSTSAIANDYIQKLWPNSYAKRRKHYDYEAQDPASLPPAGFLWTNAAQRSISMRNYGYMVNNKKEPGDDGVQVESVRDPVLAGVTNMSYRAFDLDYPDVKRAQTFLRDLQQFEANDNMPQLIVMRLGNDHTSGTAAGKIAPLSSFADNDYALGMLVEAMTRSKFWKSTAIFVLEDDAQNGPDHIDSHRSPAFVISPYTHTGAVDGTMYNTTSMLRTIELILGLRPMTQFDAAARPMFNAFSAEAVMTNYNAEKPRISLEERNPAASPSAARSREMDFSDADRADDDELNDILWRAIRHSEPPPPVRSFFVK
jgi:YVTN family beta-propeller protein